MPSSAQRSPAHHSRFWPAIVRILLVEVIILLALAGAIVGYVNWSSEAAWAEFKAASRQPAPKGPLQTVRVPAPCARNA